MYTTNAPRALRPEEWDEVAALEFVREGWGLNPELGKPGELLSSLAYGAHYDFVSGGPGYVGDLYVVQGDVVGNAPLQFIRDESGTLVHVELSCPYGRCAEG